MQIQSLTIQNFRSIQDLRIATAPTVAVFGMNGAGKSSIRMAIQMALFGRCAVTDKRGQGAAALIRYNEKQAVVVVGTDRHTIELTIKRGKTEWNCYDAASGEVIPDRSTFWKSYGINQDHAMIAAMPECYLLSRELGDVLTDFLGGSVEHSDLESCIGESSFNDLRRFCDTHGGDWTTVAGLENIGARAYAMRTEVNRRIKEVQHEIKAIGFRPAPKSASGKTLAPSDLVAVDERLGKLRQRRERLIGELGAANGPACDRDAMEQEQAELSSQIAELEHRRIKVAEELGKATITESLTLRNHEMACAESDTAHNKLQDAVKALDAVRTMKQCPTCQRSIGGDLRDKLIAPLEAAVESARAEFEPHSIRCLALDDEAQEARRIANGLRTDEAAVKSQLADVRAKHSELSAVLRAMPLSARSSEEIQSEINDIEAEIERGESLRNELQLHCDAVALDHTLNGYLDDERELSNYVRWFKDGEATKKLVSGGLIDFEAACNARLEPFSRRLSVEAEGKTVEVYLNGIPARQCSKGERTIACYAIAKAFAASGAPILLDDLNDLDGDNRRKMLKDIRRDACTWVFSAWQTPGAVTHEVAYALDPCVVVWMEQGKAVPVGVMS